MSVNNFSNLFQSNFQGEAGGKGGALREQNTVDSSSDVLILALDQSRKIQPPPHTHSHPPRKITFFSRNGRMLVPSLYLSPFPRATEGSEEYGIFSSSKTKTKMTIGVGSERDNLFSSLGKTGRDKDDLFPPLPSVPTPSSAPSTNHTQTQV